MLAQVTSTVKKISISARLLRSAARSYRLHVRNLNHRAVMPDIVRFTHLAVVCAATPNGAGLAGDRRRYPQGKPP